MCMGFFFYFPFLFFYFLFLLIIFFIFLYNKKISKTPWHILHTHLAHSLETKFIALKEFNKNKWCVWLRILLNQCCIFGRIIWGIPFFFINIPPSTQQFSIILIIIRNIQIYSIFFYYWFNYFVFLFLETSKATIITFLISIF